MMATPHSESYSEALTAALYYFEHDCFVVPCCPLDEQNRCLVHVHTIEKDIGKRPICGEQWQDLRLSREDVLAWWTQYPTANIGILLAPSRLIVLDIDSSEAELEASVKGLPPGPQVKTGRGVQHYYRNPRELHGRAIQVGESHAIDILSNGIVIGAGSRHRTGLLYQWRVSFEEWELEDAPLWATTLLKEENTDALHTDPLPNDLPTPELDALGLEPWVVHVIRYGQPMSPFTPYQSRSHALWGVTCALIQAGLDTPTIAALLLNSDYAISDKPRQQGARWLAGDIARARKAVAKAAMNGHEQPAPMREEEWSDVEEEEPCIDPSSSTDEEPHTATPPPSEEEENARATAEEREECPNDYPCPEELWIGPFAEVAEIVGIRDWRVWLATAAALAARAHRNIHTAYYGDLYAMGFFLLVAPSGTGKGMVTRLFKKLLPDNYRLFTSIESGQALPHVLAEIQRDEKGRIVNVVASPTALVVNEWSMLLSNSDIAGSTLMPRLCDVYDAEEKLDVIRSDKRGAGNIVVPKPTLTICGTTTVSEFQDCVKPKHIRSGFINRHFILPGPRISWAYNSSAEYVNYSHIQDVAARLPLAHTLGVGEPMGEMYTPAAYTMDEEWANAFFDPIHNPMQPEGETVFKRLHVYNRRIALLYAWATRHAKIQREHVRAAHLVVETSYRFLQDLFSTMPVDLPAYLKVQENVEGLITDMVITQRGIRKDDVCRRLRRHGGYTFVSQQIEKLLDAGALRVEVKRKKKLLFPIA